MGDRSSIQRENARVVAYTTLQSETMVEFANEAEETMAELAVAARRSFTVVQDHTKYTMHNKLMAAQQTDGGMRGVRDVAARGGDIDILDELYSIAINTAVGIVRESIHEELPRSNKLRVFHDDSYVHTSELAFIHVWRCRREARKFQQSMRALSNTRHKLMLPAIVAVPFTVSLIYEGRIITVTWLPPLIDHPEVPLDEETIAGRLDQILRAGVGSPVTQRGKLKFFMGSDQKFYVLSCALAPTLTGLPLDVSDVPRTEFYLRDKPQRELAGGAHEAHQDKALGRVTASLRQHFLNNREQPANTSVISRMCHVHGLNLRRLYALRVSIDEAMKRDDSAAFALAMETIDSEIVARSLKSVVESSINGAVLLAKEVFPLEKRIHIANDEIAHFFRSPTYLVSVVTPVARLKYACPSTFAFNARGLRLAYVVKHITDALGLRFDPKAKLFTSFSDTPAMSSHSGREAIVTLSQQSAGTLAQRGGVARELLGLGLVACVALKSLSTTRSGDSGEGRLLVGYAPAVAPILLGTHHAALFEEDGLERFIAEGDEGMSGLVGNGGHLGSACWAVYAGLTRMGRGNTGRGAHWSAMEVVALAEMVSVEGAVARLGVIDVVYICKRVQYHLQASHMAFDELCEPWAVIMSALIARAADTNRPLSPEVESELEVRCLLRRVTLMMFFISRAIANATVKRVAHELVVLAGSFAAGFHIPSLLMVALAAEQILEDELLANPHPHDQRDMELAKSMWEMLSGRYVAMWLLLSDTADTDRVFDKRLMSFLTDEEKIALLSFVQIVGRVGQAQRLLAPLKDFKIDHRKILLVEFAALFRAIGGPKGIDEKLRKAYDDVDIFLADDEHRAATVGEL